jgi:hypothetical protein
VKLTLYVHFNFKGWGASMGLSQQSRAGETSKMDESKQFKEAGGGGRLGLLCSGNDGRGRRGGGGLTVEVTIRGSASHDLSLRNLVSFLENLFIRQVDRQIRDKAGRMSKPSITGGPAAPRPPLKVGSFDRWIDRVSGKASHGLTSRIWLFNAG